MDAVTLTSTLWSPGTTCELYNVPWDAEYRDVVAWRDEQARDEWFSVANRPSEGASPTWRNDTMRYLRPGEPIRIPVPYSTAYQFNYVIVRNPQQPVDLEGAKRAYYYFITATRYVSPQVTEITLQLDVMTTYAPDITFGNCFVESGHVAMAAFEYARRNYLSSQTMGGLRREYLGAPEDIDTGSDYIAKNYDVVSTTYGSNAWVVVVTTTADLGLNPGDTSNPKLSTAYGRPVDGLYSGADVYTVKLDHFSEFMSAIAPYPWVSQNIISLTIFPEMDTGAVWNATLFGTARGWLGKVSPGFVQGGITGTTAPYAQRYKDSFPPFAWRFEKLLTYPYTVIELDAQDGNPVFIKPELVDDDSLQLATQSVCVPGMMRKIVYPQNYGGGNVVKYDTHPVSGANEYVSVDTASFFANAVVLDDFPSFAIVNNGYLAQLAATAHTRAYSYQSAGWTRQKGIAAANLSYGQAAMTRATQGANFDVQQDLARKQQGADVARAAITGVGQVANGIGSMSVGGIVGGVASAASTAAGAAINYGMQSASMQAAQAQFGNTQALAANVADQNLAYAKFAANGDYRNQIAAITASVQDTQLTPPSTSGQQGGNGLRYKYGYYDVVVKYKRIQGAALHTICEFWARYGYKVNRFIRLDGKRLWDLRACERATYWKMQETYITCPIANETEKQAIRGIFEKGVTLWQRPAEIGRIDFISDNKPFTDTNWY